MKGAEEEVLGGIGFVVVPYDGARGEAVVCVIDCFGSLIFSFHAPFAGVDSTWTLHRISARYRNREAK